MIDALVADKAVNIYTSEPLERAVRRLMGVHTADRTKNWNMCDALEMQDTSSTLLPPLIFDRTVKRAAQLAKLNDGGNSRNSNQRAYNDNNYYNNDNNNRGGRNRNNNYINNNQRPYNNNNNNNRNARPAQANDRPRYNNDNNRGQHAAGDQVGARI